jgi:ATP-dependent DNA ligase
MLAKLSRELPVGGEWVYEPKWDGFRSIVFKDGPEVELGSRNERPLTRYFPELVEAFSAALPERCVLDGEIVIITGGGLDFEALLQRIHPAASRVKRLAAETPAAFVAFDLLALGTEDLRARPLSDRRALLADLLGASAAPIYLTPSTDDARLAGDWFNRFEGAGLDGVVAKRLSEPYKEGERVMVKVKHERTADCVVGGFRWHKEGGTVGSLLLGLYDTGGVLHHVGVASGFSAAARKSLLDDVQPVRAAEVADHPWVHALEHTRVPGGLSRWSAGKDQSFEPLAPELVCEVAYDHLQGDRFRHATKFRRWRPDRTPASCTYEQLDTAVPMEFSQIFGAGPT